MTGMFFLNILYQVIESRCFQMGWHQTKIKRMGLGSLCSYADLTGIFTYIGSHKPLFNLFRQSNIIHRFFLFSQYKCQLRQQAHIVIIKGSSTY